MLVNIFRHQSGSFGMVGSYIDKLRKLFLELFIKIFVALYVFRSPVFIAYLQIFQFRKGLPASVFRTL